MVKVNGPYDIEAVRTEWIGKSDPVTTGRYPVEYDAIRRLCHMVEDTNPLFLDPEYARQTRYGEVIAPPVMADYFAGKGIWPRVQDRPSVRAQVPTRGDRAINLNQTFEFHKPIKVGDRLSSQVVIVDVYEKPIRLDPKAVWTVVETRITNQDGELVCTVRNTGLTHRTPEEVAAEADRRDLDRLLHGADVLILDRRPSACASP
jgi:acyl dehydratase